MKPVLIDNAYLYMHRHCYNSSVLFYLSSPHRLHPLFLYRCVSFTLDSCGFSSIFLQHVVFRYTCINE